ncbi:YbjQ family protein [Candidatus Hepatoplasma crinochetorum]|jgi:uncharacterized protein YbjQ (UPF0145 family)|uniref:Putative heavy-metal-binding protein n=1 Tax=Candidatus Hepatoplasma crinochetorum Av TaxID=1427984 RepID=W8GNS3_9MOLU|nr:YbjQ family protein [Candidatus Hepatoplasma crinochetorum]AHK22686.1 Putative heavy-metal-binding protein [Candidatus Hepatoplasma crinochetorum Av]BDV03260.1 MAG: hypothetical protein HCTKY_5540 [Candidatus Hepatoplasma crinochetorum]
MKKEQLEFIKKENYEYYLRLKTKIEENYTPSKIIKYANFSSAFFYYLGYVILITLFQNAAALASSRKRNFNNSLIYALLGFNIFFFLYLGENNKYKKYYQKELEKIEIPEQIKIKINNQKLLKKITEKDFEYIKREKLFNVNYPNNKNLIGFVYGSSIRSKSLFKDIHANIENISGGKINTYNILLNEAREEAIEKMIKDAILKYGSFEGKAIYNIRLSTSQISMGASEILVYGTLVYE